MRGEEAGGAVTVEDEIRRMFRDAGATGILHVREIGSSREVGVGADEPVVLASTFKIAVAVAFERAVSAGVIDPAERTTVIAERRRGGVGTAGFTDDVTASLRDLARLMMTLSDNAAADVVLDRVGHPAVDAVLADLGLARTRIVGGAGDLWDAMAADLGAGADAVGIDAAMAAASPDQIRAMSVLDPARTTASTPRDMTTLIDAIWTDRAAPPDACARVRDVMARQLWPQRLRSGFADDVRVAGKTGTLPSIRNEVGAVTYPDGGVYAVAVFTRADSLARILPDVDRAIGMAARRAIEHLRAAR